jgi:uncharacterized RDD family membrane protein YckC
MEITQGARELIERNLREIMDLTTLDGKDRADVEKELRSGFYEGSEAKARERNASTITEEDVRKDFAEEGTPSEIAGAYMRSYAGGLKRAGFWYRSAAYIVDMILLGVVVGILALPFIMFSVWADTIDQTSWIVAMVIIVNLVIGIIVLGVLFCYFVILEGRFGRTVGKYLLGLKVLNTGGMPVGYKEALLRNIPKFFGNFIFIDALIMVVFFGKEKQRGFDKVADTIVVHSRG